MGITLVDKNFGTLSQLYKVTDAHKLSNFSQNLLVKMSNLSQNLLVCTISPEKQQFLHGCNIELYMVH